MYPVQGDRKLPYNRNRQQEGITAGKYRIQRNRVDPQLFHTILGNVLRGQNIAQN